MQHVHAQAVPDRTAPAATHAGAGAGAPLWMLLVGLALLVLAIGPQLVAPARTTPVRPAGSVATAPAATATASPAAASPATEASSSPASDN